MEIRSLLKIIMILLISFGLASCVKKLPTPSSKNDGMLVIAQDISNKPSKSFLPGYWYSLAYSPANGPKIEIWPESKDLLLYKNFPAGKYRINYVTSNPQNRGLKTHSGQKTIPVPNPISSYYFFEIKPNHITLLDAHFIVLLYGDSKYHYSQDFKFTEITQIDREKIIEKLAKYKNSKSWILPDKIGASKMKMEPTKVEAEPTKIKMKTSDFNQAIKWINKENSRMRNEK